MVREGFPISDEIKAQMDKRPENLPKMMPERIVKQQLEGMRIGVKEFRDALAQSIKHLQLLLR